MTQRSIRYSTTQKGSNAPRNMHRKTKACKDKTGVERPRTRNKGDMENKTERTSQRGETSGEKMKYHSPQKQKEKY